MNELLVDTTYELRTLITRRIEDLIAAGSTGDVQHKEGGITLITNCRGGCEIVSENILRGYRNFTVGHTIFSLGDPGEDTIRHEKGHVRQYELLGDAFLLTYAGNGIVSVVMCAGFDEECLRDTNLLEQWAGQ